MASMDSKAESDSSIDSDYDFSEAEAVTKIITMPSNTFLYHLSYEENPFVNDSYGKVYHFSENESFCVKATRHWQSRKQDDSIVWMHVYKTTAELILLQEIEPRWRDSIHNYTDYCREKRLDGWHLKVSEDNPGLQPSDAQYETALFNLNKVGFVSKTGSPLSALKCNLPDTQRKLRF